MCNFILNLMIFYNDFVTQCVYLICILFMTMTHALMQNMQEPLLDLIKSDGI